MFIPCSLLEEVNPVLFIQRNDGLFPRLRAGELLASAPRLALTGLRVHAEHGHVEQFMHSSPYIALRCEAMDLERVGVVSRRAVHTLFGHERPQDDLVRLEDDFRRLWYGTWHSVISTQSSEAA
jgi:hypothetical protein